jgi:hypothetical protein
VLLSRCLECHTASAHSFFVVRCESSAFQRMLGEVKRGHTVVGGGRPQALAHLFTLVPSLHGTRATSRESQIGCLHMPGLDPSRWASFPCQFLERLSSFCTTLQTRATALTHTSLLSVGSLAISACRAQLHGCVSFAHRGSARGVPKAH